MKRLAILGVISIATLLMGCEQTPVRVEQLEVEATVKELDYTKSRTSVQAVPMGKMMSSRTIHHPAEYEVELDYKGVMYELDNKEVYNSLEDKLYKAVKCVLEVSYYEDGSTTSKIVKVENINVK